MNPFSFSEYIIRKDNLTNNVKILKDRIKPGVELCGVVKADSYGVGAVNVSHIIDSYVDAYAVANLNEAVELRKNGITKNILVLGSINFEALDLYSLYKITPTVNCFFELSKLSSLVKNPMTLEFALNTGMNRFGFKREMEILEGIAVVNKNNFIDLVGAYSHLATKEDDKNFICKQKEVFDDFIKLFNNKKLKFHISNTNAVLNHPELNYDRVRTGFGLYGMSRNDFGLKPAVEITTKIININELKRGESVGYDRTFVAKRASKIAVLPLGYFDGINRRVSNFGKVLINGKFASIVGRVCMDAMMVDVTDVDGAIVGSKVTIVGGEGDRNITIDDYAEWSDTSSYEALTRFNRARMREVIC